MPDSNLSKPIPRKNQFFVDEIAKQYACLTPTARRVAEYLQRDPFCVLVQSVQQIADNTQTSKATVSRFFRQLGYSSHQVLKATLIKQREQGVPVASVQDIDTSHKQELDNIHRTLENITHQEIEIVAQSLMQAKRVWIIGFRTSYPLALSLCQQLKQIRQRVTVLPTPGQTLSEDIVDIDKNDFVVVFGFRRRVKLFASLIAKLNHAQTLLLTDSTGQMYQPNIKHMFVCELGHAQAFDSYASVMSVSSLICNSAYQLAHIHNQSRIQSISCLYEDLDELN